MHLADPSFQPFTNDFPQADIHELLSSDILHQLIKGTFKDHLVTWVRKYLELHYGKKCAKEILDDIDKWSMQNLLIYDEVDFFFLSGLQLSPHSLEFNDSPKGGDSSNGLVMTLRHWWRFVLRVHIVPGDTQDIFTGLSTHNIRSRSSKNGADSPCIPWLLLYCSL